MLEPHTNVRYTKPWATIVAVEVCCLFSKLSFDRDNKIIKRATNIQNILICAKFIFKYIPNTRHFPQQLLF